MARGKAKETLLESCKGILDLGNIIAVHALEYLSLVPDPPSGFKEVAIDFIQVSRSLFVAKAGLAEAANSTKLPADVLKELEEQFHHTRNAFLVWDQIVSKFLSTEKRKMFGKLGKGFRMMFAESDLQKMRTSFNQCRASLSISALMFTSTLGAFKVDEAAAIGYTALAAVLHCPDPTVQEKTTSAPKKPREPAQIASPPRVPPPRSPLPPLPPINASHSRSHTLESSHLSNNRTPDSSHDRFPFSPVSSQLTGVTFPFNDGSFVGRDIDGDSMSDVTSVASKVHIQSAFQQRPASAPKQAIRLKLDPTQAPRWKPSRSTGQVSEASKAALASAVQQKDHKMLEQLLDHGIPAGDWTAQNLLRESIVNHDMESLRLLLLFGADPNAKDSDGATPLYAATGYSFFEAAQLLIRYGADPDVSAGPYGENPFSTSLTATKAPFSQLYLQYGVDPNTVMGNGETPFTQAMNKYTPMGLVELMLLYDADPNRKNARGETALFRAINASRHDIVLNLLHHGADPNMPGPKIVLWPAVHQPKMLEALLENGADLTKAPGVLELATSINSPEAVNILLKHKADPNAKKDGIYTPLCSAIRDDREELVETLLAAGADPNLAALDFPVFKCITYHRTHLLPRVIAAGANPNNPKGAIESAVAHNNKDALLYLLDHGVDPNARNSVGNSPLTTAIRENCVELIDILLSYGADPGLRGQDWPISMAVKRPGVLAKLLPHLSPSKIIKGAMEMAVIADQLESIKLLIAKGVDVEEKNGGVFSPLTTSIRENRKEIFRYLVDEAGADPNAPGEHLPIIKAIRRHREDDMSYIEHLLDKGADINLMYRGWNAVLQALDNGDMKILKLLASKGKPDLTAVDENGRSVRDILHERELDEEEEILVGGN